MDFVIIKNQLKNYSTFSFLIIIVLFITNSYFSQTYTMSNGGSANSCTGTFLDPGGNSNYSGGTSTWTYTICNPNPGQPIYVDFNSFSLWSNACIWGASVDELRIYNGSGTTSLLGSYIETNSPGLVVGTTGCLTFQFVREDLGGFLCDANSGSSGWSATISCTPPPGDGTSCFGSFPFCTGTTYNFPNSTTTQAITGPDYDCLGSQPNPIWYYMQIDQNGPIQINISQTTGPNGTGTGLDVDFALWGPFTSLNAGCTGIQSGQVAPIQSSFDAAPTETVGIGVQGGVDCGFGVGQSTPPPAQIGQYYILLITNYDGSSGYIQFSQTNSAGQGSADCSFTCGTNLTAIPTVCASNTYTLNGTLTLTSSPGISVPNTGTVTISSNCGGTPQVFNLPNNNISYSIPNLPANGTQCVVSAVFSNFPTCNDIQTYQAPQACNPVCNISSVTANPTACNSVNNQYNLSGAITFTNPPATGTLTVANSCGTTQTFNAPFTSPINYNFTGLTANGNNCSVTATFSASPACTLPQNYTAPSACQSSGGCNIAQINAAMAGAGFQPLNVTGFPCALYYYNPNTTNSWTTAQSQANAVGATLLTVCSLAENNAVWNAAQAAGITGGLWIGYTDQVTEGSWIWQDGSTCTFTNWNAGEPSNSSCFGSTTGEDGAVIQMNNGKWNDVYLGPTGVCVSPASYASLVKVNLCPQVSATVNPSPVCVGDPVQLSATTILGSSPFSYTWTNASSTQIGTGSPLTYTATGNATINVLSTDQYGCTATSTVNITTQNCGGSCSFTDITGTITNCDVVTNQYTITGTVTFTNAPSTGTLTLLNSCGGSQIFNPPFTGSVDYSFVNNADGSPCTITASFSDDQSCTATLDFDASPPCTCPADIGTYNYTVDGTAVDPNNPIKLCYGSQFSIVSNNDWTPPNETTGGIDPNPPSYTPGIYWLIYSCPPTFALTPTLADLNNQFLEDDPCLQGVISSFPSVGDLNDLSIINAFPAGTFNNNTIYYVPLTMYDTTAGTYSYIIEPALMCYEMGSPIAVQYLPDVTYTQTQNCANGTVTATISGGDAQVNGSNFSIVPGSITPATAQPVNSTTSNGGTITLGNLQTGPYSFDVQDANGCSVTISGNYTGAQTASLSYNDDLFCLDDPDPTATVVGTPGGTFSSTSGLVLNPTNGSIDLSLSNPGTYLINYTTPGPLCPGSDNFSITIQDNPVVDAGEDVTVCVRNAITLEATGADSYSWNYGLLNGIPYLPNLGTTEFIVVGSTNGGCSGTDTVLVTVVEDCSDDDEVILWVPNTFTPDNDQFNQSFHVIFYSGFDPFAFELTIFNRWGELIWESHDVNVGWDGTYNNGMKVPDGVYTWKLKYKRIQNDLKETVFGHVTVIR